MSEISTVSKPEAAETQLVVFVLAGCEAAVGIRQVREILRVGDITRMPKAPPFLEGIINMRGKIIPVIDLKKRFQMPLVDRTDESRVLIVEIQDQMIGFLVDKVAEVLRVPQASVEPAKRPVLSIGVEYLDGFLRLERRLILLLNLKKLLTLDDTKVLPEGEHP
ncbi:MAG TPA: chemotaxis protein CheW, partial [bacterium]|nr:chemotaxis protein CheW [bacterium]